MKTWSVQWRSADLIKQTADLAKQWSSEAGASFGPSTQWTWWPRQGTVRRPWWRKGPLIWSQYWLARSLVYCMQLWSPFRTQMLVLPWEPAMVSTCGLDEAVWCVCLELAAPALHEDSFGTMAASFSAKTLASIKPSQDADLDVQVWNATIAEVSGGSLEGPCNIADLPQGHVVSPRFGLRQGAKVRPITTLALLAWAARLVCQGDCRWIQQTRWQPWLAVACDSTVRIGNWSAELVICEKPTGNWESTRLITSLLG